MSLEVAHRQSTCKVYLMLLSSPGRCIRVAGRKEWQRCGQAGRPDQSRAKQRRRDAAGLVRIRDLLGRDRAPADRRGLVQEKESFQVYRIRNLLLFSMAIFTLVF